MIIFLDSADTDEIRNACRMGIIDGVTTNPSLIANQSVREFDAPTSDTFFEIVSNIVESLKSENEISLSSNMDEIYIHKKYVSVEVGATTYDDMIAEGETILSISDMIILKLPVTHDGIMACKYFADRGHLVNMTLCFSVSQALCAAKAGATFISPFIGRLDDSGVDGLSVLADIHDAVTTYEFPSKVLASSIRSMLHVNECIRMGVGAITVPYKVLSQMLHHDLTDKGLHTFLSDWQKSKLNIL